MMKTKQLHPYEAPASVAFEVTGNHPVLTSDIDALAIDTAIGSIDEITFTDFNQTF